jgi:hypothetical protein
MSVKMENVQICCIGVVIVGRFECQTDQLDDFGITVNTGEDAKTGLKQPKEEAGKFSGFRIENLMCRWGETRNA